MNTWTNMEEHGYPRGEGKYFVKLKGKKRVVIAEFSDQGFFVSTSLRRRCYELDPAEILAWIAVCEYEPHDEENK